ncbi:hypothetical protein TNCV_2640101 [Trichonephila clavipes]|nr:hypothetical protein TNCV_2640101 [Trichonephila clavipes]
MIKVSARKVSDTSGSTKTVASSQEKDLRWLQPPSSKLVRDGERVQSLTFTMCKFSTKIFLIVSSSMFAKSDIIEHSNVGL